MRRLKVAIYSGEIPSATFIDNLADSVGENGVTVILFGKRRNRPLRPNSNTIVKPTPRFGWKTFVFVLFHGTKLLIQNPGNFKKLRIHIRSMKIQGVLCWWWWSKYLPVVLNLPDIFHIQWARDTQEWLFLKKIFGVKIIVSLRGSQINYSALSDHNLALAYQRSFTDVDGFHAVCSSIATQAFKYGADRHRTKVIYSGVKSELFDDRDCKSRSNLNQIQIVSVGRIHWVKGYHIALQAMKNLLHDNVGFHYTIIGDGNTEELLYLIEEFKLSNHVTVTESLSQTQLFEFLKNCDVMLLPSVTEGIANVVLEAMAVGLPVISSDCGGMAEVVKEDETGLLFRNRDVDHLTRQLRKFVDMSQASKSKMVSGARKMISEKFTSDRLGKEMTTFYLSVYNNKELL